MVQMSGRIMVHMGFCGMMWYSGMEPSGLGFPGGTVGMVVGVPGAKMMVTQAHLSDRGQRPKLFISFGGGGQ